MSQDTSQWDMLKDALRAAIEALPEYRVTHALFTTYAFDPEFFETSILPLLMADGGQGLSLHSAVRRLQMESLLRESPIAIDVYFDARVVVPGCPLLPYSMLPVRIAGEFHGKLILLRLENAQGNVRCVLGAGSANLTKAGWWENIESWFFAPSFDPARPPTGILPGLDALFEFLGQRGQPDGATANLRNAFNGATHRQGPPGAPVFALFTPRTTRFSQWLGEHVHNTRKDTRLEVISPYFADVEHAELVHELLKATGTSALDLWLPIDPWQAGGPAALIEEDCYDTLREVDGLRWCGFREPGLAANRREGAPPRFLHAKVIRRPGTFCFMGSVNFSNKAFNSNFEAGFLFPDKDGAWLRPVTMPPSRFVKPSEPACHEGVGDSGPELCAGFHWDTLKLSFDFIHAKERRKCAGTVVRLVDAQGGHTGRCVELPGSLTLTADAPLYSDLKTNPWIKVAFPDNSIAVVWVQQYALDHRPPPADLRPDVWHILEMWRGLAGGGTGSSPGDYAPLEVLLERRGDGGEAPPAGVPEQDIFETMAAAHGSFYLLRTRLREERERDNLARREYYFSAPRPDSLANLVARIEQPPEAVPVDAVAAWVMLLWVVQICTDNRDLASARALCLRAQTLIESLLTREPMSVLDPTWLEWAKRMFLCAPGKEHGVARHFRSKGAL